MITYEITEATILTALSTCEPKIKMFDLFDLLPDTGAPQESAVTFIKTLNQLLEVNSVQTTLDGDGLIYWSITPEGKEHLHGFLNP